MNDNYYSCEQKHADMNKVLIPTDYNEGRNLSDFSVESGCVKAIFKNLEGALIKEIRQADVVVGCVAWLTSEAILKALACRQHVSIIVQKEDFLRPDLTSRRGWTGMLRRLYGALPDWSRFYAPYL